MEKLNKPPKGSLLKGMEYHRLLDLRNRLKELHNTFLTNFVNSEMSYSWILPQQELGSWTDFTLFFFFFAKADY